MVGLRHQPRPQRRAAAHERCIRRRVMRAEERPAEPVAGLRLEAGHAPDDGHVAGLSLRQGRQQAGRGPRQQGLASAGRPQQQQVVASGQGDLQGPAGMLLTAHVCQLRPGPATFRRTALPWRRAWAEGRDRARRASRDADGRAAPCRCCEPATGPGHQAGHVVQAVRPDDVDARHELGLPEVPQRNADAAVPGVSQGRHHGQDPGHRHDAAVEGELPEQGPRATGGADLLRGEQDADGDGDVVGSTVLASIGGGQVHRDA